MTQHEFENLENGLSKLTRYTFISGIIIGILFSIALVGIIFIFGNLKIS